MWKLRTLFDVLNDSYARFYNPSEHLAVHEDILLFKGRVIFKKYIPKSINVLALSFIKYVIRQVIPMTCEGMYT